MSNLLKKKCLVHHLQRQVGLMVDNADLMESLIEGSNHRELRGAAMITKDWIKAIELEIKSETTPLTDITDI